VGRRITNRPGYLLIRPAAAYGEPVDLSVAIETATIAHLPRLAVLRWRWARPDETATPAALREFGSALGDWMTRQGDASIGKLAVLDSELVGMAWLAVFDRVPNPGDLNRRSGDVQSVFVVPEHRGHGIGRLLMEAICETADGLGIRKLTVDSSAAAVPFYQRFGFTLNDQLLQRVAAGVARRGESDIAADDS
jgi:GNAT superfamily N-acetyltransferase